MHTVKSTSVILILISPIFLLRSPEHQTIQETENETYINHVNRNTPWTEVLELEFFTSSAHCFNGKGKNVKFVNRVLPFVIVPIRVE